MARQNKRKERYTLAQNYMHHAYKNVQITDTQDQSYLPESVIGPCISNHQEEKSYHKSPWHESWIRVLKTGGLYHEGRNEIG